MAKRDIDHRRTRNNNAHARENGYNVTRVKENVKNYTRSDDRGKPIVIVKEVYLDKKVLNVTPYVDIVSSML